jgi:hypothetical protein
MIECTRRAEEREATDLTAVSLPVRDVSALRRTS